MQNIETLKKLVHLYRGDYVYFEFKNTTDFNIVRYPEIDYDIHDLHLKGYWDENLPFARLFPEGKAAYLRYGDQNISFVLNLITKKYTLSDVNAPVDISEVRHEFQELLRNFK